MPQPRLFPSGFHFRNTLIYLPRFTGFSARETLWGSCDIDPYLRTAGLIVPGVSPQSLRTKSCPGKQPQALPCNASRIVRLI